MKPITLARLTWFISTEFDVPARRMRYLCYLLACRLVGEVGGDTMLQVERVMRLPDVPR